MQLRLPAYAAAPLLFILICSCAGTMSFREPVQMPEEDIAELAAQIEELVLNTKMDEPSLSDYEVDGESFDIDPLSAMISVDEIREKAPALARINADNEVVLMAIRGRILRRPAVEEFERNGCVGENRRALLQYLGNDWCPEGRNLRSRASYVVLTENRDRRTIYEHIVKANDLRNSAMGRVREIFAEQIHEKAWAGTPLEMPDGTWKRR